LDRDGESFPVGNGGGATRAAQGGPRRRASMSPAGPAPGTCDWRPGTWVRSERGGP